MSEGNHSANDLFIKAADFWRNSPHTELSPLGTEHIENVLQYTQEHPEEVEKRARQLDVAINRFNEKRKSDLFKSDETNSKKLATDILEPDEPLPLVSEMPSESDSVNPFFAAFTNLIRTKYYTFVDKPEINDPRLLITGLLVDGYGVALRAKRAIEHKRTVGKDDLIIVNAICEMVEPGTLQTEMYLANWYKPNYGLNPEFCDRIHKQFGKLKPLVNTKTS